MSAQAKIDEARRLLTQAAGLLSYHAVSNKPAPVGDIVAATAKAERATTILRDVLLAAAPARPKPATAVHRPHGERLHPAQETKRRRAQSKGQSPRPRRV